MCTSGRRLLNRFTPAEREKSAASFSFAAVRCKKISAAFDGGRLTKDGGVLLMA